MNNKTCGLRFFHPLILLMLGICLLTALVPLTDFDSDGVLDSFITDGLVLAPILFLMFGLICLLTSLPDVYLATPQLYSSLLVPPPNIF
jgi:hypothetical protein